MKELFTVSINDDSKVEFFVKGFLEGKNFPVNIPNPDFNPKKNENPLTNPREIDSGVSELEFMKTWIIRMLKSEVSNGHAAIKNRAQNKSLNKLDLS